MRFRLIDTFPDFASDSFNIQEHNRQFRDSSVVIQARAKQVYYSDHWTPLSIKCAFGGDEHYRSHAFHYTVNAGRYLVLNRDTHYESFIDSPTEVESFTINFTPTFESRALAVLNDKGIDLLEEGCPLRSEFRLTPMLRPFGSDPFSHHVQRLRRAVNDPDSIADIDHVYLDLFESLVMLENNTRHSMRSVDAIRATTRQELFIRLTRAKDFIASCYNQPLLLHEIADIACLDQFYFLRQFKRMFGETPIQFLQRCRLENAHRLLIETDAPVSDVCLKVGFEDPSSFGKLFKRTFGQTPGSVRDTNS